jgi:integrase
MNKRKNGEGTVYQRASDGRWAGGITTDGKRKWFHGATAEEVVTKLTEAREQQRKHIPFTDERLTVGHWLETWLRNVRPPATSPKTWITYEGFVRLHLLPKLGHIRLARLLPQDVRDFLSERLDAGLSPRTVAHLRTALCIALNQAIGDDLVRRNVASKVEPPEIQPRELDVLSPEEARSLLKAARGHRLEALFAAATGLGLRLGECLGLQWSNVDFHRRVLTVAHSLQRLKRVRRGDVVREGEAKSELLLGQPKGKKVKSLRLPLAVLEALRRHQQTQAAERLLAGPAWRGSGAYVFTSTVGTPLEPRRLHHEFKELCDRAGLRRIRFHDLRHSAASLLIAQGVHAKAIQELLRHSSIRLTMDVYGHLLDEVQQDTADKMDAVLGHIPEPVAVNVAVKTRLRRVK